MPRYALRLAYDGRDFAGAWRQADRRSVLAELGAACARLGEGEVDPVPASRTDAGVHAAGNVAHLDLERRWDPVELVAALEHQLPPDLACHAAAAVDAGWSARSAASKTYRYRIDRGQPRDPQRRHRWWRAPLIVDDDLLGDLAAELTDLTDAAGFARARDHRTAHPIRIASAHWTAAVDALNFTITADRFSLRLVRSLVGAQIAIAAGQRPRADWTRLLAGRAAPAGDQVAPAHGLELCQVAYAPEPAWRAAFGTRGPA